MGENAPPKDITFWSSGVNRANTLQNVAFRGDEIHLYGVSEVTRQTLKDVDRLPAYKRWDGKTEKQLWDLPTPKVRLHAEPISDSVCDGGIRNEMAFFYSPWQTDNMFHAHND